MLEVKKDYNIGQGWAIGEQLSFTIKKESLIDILENIQANKFGEYNFKAKPRNNTTNGSKSTHYIKLIIKDANINS